MWRIWLYKTKRTRKFSPTIQKRIEQNFFITSNALISIELNAHCLIYVYLLIEQKLIPESTASSMHLFSSQPCENVFRDARALSGIYSTRINFTMKQFLQRINKLNALTELKQFESNNMKEKINFPVHHKVKQHTVEVNSNNVEEGDDYNLENVEKIIILAYETAQEMVVSVGMNKDLVKYNLFNIEESSNMAQKLLKLNCLTESEILVLDTRDNEDSDDEGGFNEGDFDEGDFDEGDLGGDAEGNDDYESDGIDENCCEEDDHPEDGDIEDYIDEDGDEALNENIYDHYSSEDDPQPTPSFENLQATSYSGVYSRNCFLGNAG
jgi:hypothetical protein